MGRPPLTEHPDGSKFTAIRLPPELWERIERVAGKGQRAKFIRAAIEAELERRESQK